MPITPRPRRADRPGSPPDRPRDHPTDRPIGRHSVPPTDGGRRLATIRRGPDAELRVVLVAGDGGRPDRVSIRGWARADDGAMWPRPGRYVGVNLDEVPMVVEALKLAAGSAGGGAGSGEDGGLDRLRAGVRAISSRCDRRRDDQVEPVTIRPSDARIGADEAQPKSTKMGDASDAS